MILLVIISCAATLDKVTIDLKISALFTSYEQQYWDRYLRSTENLIRVSPLTGEEGERIRERLTRNLALARKIYGNIPPNLVRRIDRLIRHLQKMNYRKLSLKPKIVTIIPKVPIPEVQEMGNGIPVIDTMPPDLITLTLPQEPVKTHFVYHWPVSPIKITSAFGYRANPFNRAKLNFHDGVDLGVPTGTPVKAPGPGLVLYAGWRKHAGSGWAILLLHPGNVRTYYCHLSALFVKKGDRVLGGSLIALSGNSGRSTGPHLHFSVLIGRHRVNPLLVIGERSDRVAK